MWPSGHVISDQKLATGNGFLGSGRSPGTYTRRGQTDERRIDGERIHDRAASCQDAQSKPQTGLQASGLAFLV
jgi:hypothetical protein